jgi:hypothetical protein
MPDAIGLALFCALPIGAQTSEWSKIGKEEMRHFQSFVQVDSTGAPGVETRLMAKEPAAQRPPFRTHADIIGGLAPRP